MLERKRKSKHYNLVVGDEDADVELGEGIGAVGGQETGITGATLEQEVDNWDENAEDWDDDEPTTTEGDGPKTPNTEDDHVVVSAEEAKSRSD
jgi:hypothetical protein